MRQPALIARAAPAPYSAPATVGRVASEFRNTRLKSKTSVPPALIVIQAHEVIGVVRAIDNYDRCAMGCRLSPV